METPLGEILADVKEQVEVPQLSARILRLVSGDSKEEHEENLHTAALLLAKLRKNTVEAVLTELLEFDKACKEDVGFSAEAALSMIHSDFGKAIRRAVENEEFIKKWNL